MKARDDGELAKLFMLDEFARPIYKENTQKGFVQHHMTKT